MSLGSSQLDSLIIQAGAGAGKTTTLVKTFIENAHKFKKSHGRFPRIVVTTFTRKATQELKERLFTEAYKNDDQELVEYLNRKSWVHISTIHGILVPFLSRYGVKSGLNPELKMITQLNADQALKRMCKKVFQRQPDLVNLLEELSWKDLVKGLNKYIEYRLSYGEVKPDSSELIQALSQKKIEELKWKHKSLCFKFKKLELSAAWNQYLENFGLNFNTWTELEYWSETLEKRPGFSQKKPPFDIDLFYDFKSFLDEVDNELGNRLNFPHYWEDFDKLQTQFFKLSEILFPEHLRYKLDTGNITMADLELLTLEVLRRNPGVGELFAAEWDYWMIDEYQDTSPIQVKILKSFVREKPHFVVGDPQQSIYLFRGARTEVFQEKLEEMKRNGHRLDKLEKNYRSRHELVRFFNDIFPRLSPQFSAMEVGSPRTDETVPAAVITVVPKTSQEKPQFSSEILTVLAQVQELLKQGAKPESIAILSRKRSFLAEFLAAAQSYSIPVQCPTLTSYWSRREILDLLLLTHFLLNPHNNVNLIGLLRSPWFWAPEDAVIQIQDSKSYWRRGWELVDSLPELRGPLEKLSELRKKAQSDGLSSALREFISGSDFLVSSLVIDSTGRREANIWKFITDLRNRESEPGANLIEFLDEIMEAESTDVDNDEGEAIPVIEPDRISLLTIHASKGLQFDHVFVAGLGRGLLSAKTQLYTFDEESRVLSLSLKDESGKMMSSPTAQNAVERLKRREQEESLRVLYVAMTRAKETLWLSTHEDVRGDQHWWAQLPIAKEEGQYEFLGGFYIVQKLSREPEEMSASHSASVQKVLPLESNTQSAALKVSVTGVLGNLKYQKGPSGFTKVKALEKAQRGTAAHRVFEALALRKGQAWEVGVEWKAALEFIKGLKAPPMDEILKVGSPEWGFAVQMDGVVLQGSIDLWAELEEAVYIVDYKTGSLAHADSAFEQMEMYSKALKKMGACSVNKPHQLVAIFPFEERVLVREIKVST